MFLEDYWKSVWRMQRFTHFLSRTKSLRPHMASTSSLARSLDSGVSPIHHVRQKIRQMLESLCVCVCVCVCVGVCVCVYLWMFVCLSARVHHYQGLHRVDSVRVLVVVCERDREGLSDLKRERIFFKMPSLQRAKVSNHAKGITWLCVCACAVWVGVYMCLQVWKCRCACDAQTVINFLCIA